MTTFGTAPKMEGASIPKASSLKDDVKVAAAIGSIGGYVQTLLASSAFYFGRMSRDEKVATYSFDKAFEAYYDALYANRKGLTDDSKKQLRLSITAYSEIARLPYETRDIAEWALNLPAPVSMPQKGTLLRKVVKTYGTTPPTKEQLAALVPGDNGGKKTPPAVLPKAKGIVSSFKAIRDDAKVFKLISADKEMLNRFTDAEKAASHFATYAEQNKPEKKAARKASAKPNTSVIAAAAKALANAKMPAGAKAN